jgi:hypothetical protein
MNYQAVKQGFNGQVDGTYTLQGAPISFENGWQVSFERPDDEYTEAQFNAIVDELASQGIVCIGVWGGVKEISVHIPQFRQAVAIAVKYSQDAIWSWGTMEALSRYEFMQVLENLNKR